MGHAPLSQKFEHCAHIGANLAKSENTATAPPSIPTIGAMRRWNGWPKRAEPQDDCCVAELFWSRESVDERTGHCFCVS